MANSSEILYAVPIMSRLQRLFVVLSWGAAFTMASACKDREQSAPERTEPWRRDQAEDSTKQTQTINYRVLPGARLQLALPTRRAAPQGTFTQVSGELSLDLNQLQFTRGRVLVHLPSLTMNDALPLPPLEHTSLDPGFGLALAATSWTTHAQNWLGLGAAVEPSARSDAAVFEIDSARDLSHPRAALGAPAPRSASLGSHKHARVVHATVVGKLALRHRFVVRTSEVEVWFYYDEEVTKNAIPSELEVRLRGRLDVPLSEYDIVPRDSAGHEQSDLVVVLGELVNRTAQITGTVRFERRPFDGP